MDMIWIINIIVSFVMEDIILIFAAGNNDR